MGQVITDANLVIANDCHVYLIDNPNSGIEVFEDEFFDPNTFPYGVNIDAPFTPEQSAILLSSVNDPNSSVWNVFETAPVVGEHVYSSTMLELIDAAGTGRSFGFFVFGEFNEISLNLEVSDMATGNPAQNINFKVNLLYDFMEHWLEEDVVGWPDYNGDNKVNMLDWNFLSKGYSP